MANILDYLQWRGDLPFAVSPFNEVDNYILCKLGTPDYAGMVPPDGQVPLCMAVNRYFSGEERNMGVFASDLTESMLRLASQTLRFSPVRAGDYINIVDPVVEEQFSALTLWLPDGSRYVSFRGTDDTIVAWKEDFLLSVEDVIPAQRDAAEYLLRQARKEPGKLYVGGHSKGGNLAVYAAMMAPPEVQDRIAAVYNNDGPGFRRDITVDPRYQRIRSKVHTIVSQYTMVGVLLNRETNCTIVCSDQSGIAAHDGFHWQVKGTAFERCDDFSQSTKAFENALKEIAKRMDEQEQRALVDSTFEVLTSTGAVTLTDLTEQRLRQSLAMASGLRKAPEVTKFISILLGWTLREALVSTRQPRTSRKRFRWKRKGDVKKARTEESTEPTH